MAIPVELRNDGLGLGGPAGSCRAREGRSVSEIDSGFVPEVHLESADLQAAPELGGAELEGLDAGGSETAGQETTDTAIEP
jgi:hypothetical protein